MSITINIVCLVVSLMNLSDSINNRVEQKKFNLVGWAMMAIGCSLILLGKLSYSWLSPIGLSIQVMAVAVIITMYALRSRRA